MKQIMKWLFVEEQGNSVVFRCSVCNSEITVQYGEELPYCKHCESEPDGEQIANKMTDNEIIKVLERCSDGTGKGIIKATLDLIKRKDEQIEALIAGQETLQKALAEKDAEIERLRDSIKEADNYFSEGDFAKGLAIIINLVKEMVGEK